MYPEPYPPNLAAKTTSWNMSRIDQYVVDFCAATKGGDCHETIIFIGPLPPWFYYAAPGGGMGRSTSTSGNKAICNATDPKYCAGPLVDPSGKAAGEYYSRIISWFMKGGFTDELGRVHTGGHHFNFQFWEVLNEPDLYVSKVPPPPPHTHTHPKQNQKKKKHIPSAISKPSALIKSRPIMMALSAYSSICVNGSFRVGSELPLHPPPLPPHSSFYLYYTDVRYNLT